ncbi:MAG: ATP-binding protein, partial [Candidatus Thermoplasmatota archaeon]|nr:ATP-binding protein [Candidatus Thermoplasmatota archaeon]
SDRVVIGVKIHEDRELGRVFIEMSDHGPGIPDDMKDLMFQRFEKGGALSHMGLGLSLVKALTNIYNGNIEVKDRIEGVREWGSKFIVDFPVANIQEGRIEAGDTSEKK